MDRYFLDMLYLVSCAVHDKQAVLRKDMNFAKIIMEADGQDCRMWVISAALSAKNSDIFPDNDKYKALLIQYSAKEAIRRINAAKVIQGFSDDGLSPVIIKGETLAMLYPNPVLRESVDTDIFFAEKEQCDFAFDKLLKTGSNCPYPDRIKKHAVISHPTAGRLELHYDLYDHDFHKLHLNSEKIIQEPFEPVLIKNNFKMTTLGKTDSLKFILCHMINHFLFSRCDIKQMVDICIYIRTYKDDINWNEFKRFLNNTGYTDIFNTIIGIGTEYLGFYKTDFIDTQYSKTNVELLLEDCLSGCTRGVWSSSSLSRGCGIISGKLNNEGFFKSSVKFFKRTLNVIFPKAHFLFKTFPYCKKNKLLLPVAWIHNIASLVSGIFKTRNIFKRRKRVLVNLGFIGKYKEPMQ